MDSFITDDRAWFINDLALDCYIDARKDGLWPNKSAEIDALCAERIAYIHCELSKALEGFDGRALDDELPKSGRAEMRLAVAVLSIFELSAAMGHDIGSAMQFKVNDTLRLRGETHD